MGFFDYFLFLFNLVRSFVSVLLCGVLDSVVVWEGKWW